jgi:hypothetical protein
VQAGEEGEGARVGGRVEAVDLLAAAATAAATPLGRRHSQSRLEKRGFSNIQLGEREGRERREARSTPATLPSSLPSLVLVQAVDVLPHLGQHLLLERWGLERRGGIGGGEGLPRSRLHPSALSYRPAPPAVSATG